MKYNNLYSIRLDPINKRILSIRKLRKYLDYEFIYKTLSVLRDLELETEA